MPEEILRQPVLNVQGIPPLPQETLAAAHANALEWMKIRVATSQDLRNAITDLERFTGEMGELNHFLKGGDRLLSRIEAKIAENLIDRTDAEALKAALVCRVKRNILNQIQADEETPWVVVKDRLKKVYGGGRWTPEEDIFQMFRETKHPRQTNGEYAGTLLARFKQITEKMRETMCLAEVEARMAFLSLILKVQLAKETGKREGLPKDRTFVECAQEMVDSCAREEDTRMEVEETGWSRVSYKQPRATTTPWKRRETIHSVKERHLPVERRPGPRPKSNLRREERKCYGCGKPGHLFAQCPRTICHQCKTEGHIARECPYIYSSRKQSRGEPMEINAQKVERKIRFSRRSRSSTESTEISGTSETEGEYSETDGRRGEVVSRGEWRGRSGRSRVEADI